MMLRNYDGAWAYAHVLDAAMEKAVPWGGLPVKNLDATGVYAAGPMVTGDDDPVGPGRMIGFWANTAGMFLHPEPYAGLRKKFGRRETYTSEMHTEFRELAGSGWTVDPSRVLPARTDHGGNMRGFSDHPELAVFTAASGEPKALANARGVKFVLRKFAEAKPVFRFTSTMAGSNRFIPQVIATTESGGVLAVLRCSLDTFINDILCEHAAQRTLAEAIERNGWSVPGAGKHVAGILYPGDRAPGPMGFGNNHCPLAARLVSILVHKAIASAIPEQWLQAAE